MSEVVLVTGRSCSNCVMLKKMLDLMKLEYSYEVDAECRKGQEIVEFANARSIPVLARFDDEGKIDDFVVGINHSNERFKELCDG